MDWGSSPSSATLEIHGVTRTDDGLHLSIGIEQPAARTDDASIHTLAVRTTDRRDHVPETVSADIYESEVREVTGFELGVATLNGVTRADLVAIDPAIVHYIDHLHVATAAFIIATGIALTGLAWYGVRSGQLWAWTTAVAAAVVGLGIALPMHYADLFTHDWVIHLGPIYLATIVFVAGAVLAYRGIRYEAPPVDPDGDTGVQ